MGGKVILVVLLASSSCNLNNIRKPVVAYQQIMTADECAEVAEKLNRYSQGAVCISMEDEDD